MKDVIVLDYTSGWKYQTNRPLEWKLINDFNLSLPFTGRYYSLVKRGDSWYIKVHAGCCWDGPTWFPDFRWIMLASLIHDILHWMIAKGIIDVDCNDLIDKELSDIIRLDGGPMSWLRAWYVGRATNKVNQKLGEEKKIHRVSVFREDLDDKTSWT